MAKYDALCVYLKSRSGSVVQLSFEDIDRVVGGLPASAHNHRAWWANERDGRHVQASGWLDAGWVVDEVSLQAGTVRFRQR